MYALYVCGPLVKGIIKTLNYFYIFCFKVVLYFILYLMCSTEGVSTDGEWSLCIPDPSITDVRVHDQLHSQAQTPARKIHDE